MSRLRLVAPVVGDAPGDNPLKEFHRVGRVLPQNQDVVSVPPDMPVQEAFAVLEENGFSQVPVMAGSRVIGSFSYRSFAREVAETFGEKGQDFSEIHVSEFVEPLSFARLNEELPNTFRALDEDAAVLIDNDDNLVGVLTTIDMLLYLYEIASPFVVVAEIELTLRQILSACCPGEVLDVCVGRALKSRPGPPPETLEEMTFNDYVLIIGHGDNWAHFSDVLGGPTDYQRKRTRAKLDSVRELRNVIFHFRRRITEKERRDLQTVRTWLLGKATQLEVRGNQADEGQHGA